MDKFKLIFIALGLLFLFLIPPFQKPDEVVQYYKTIAFASGSFSCSLYNNRPSHFIPSYLADLPKELFTESLEHNTQVKVSKPQYFRVLTQTQFNRTFVAEPTACPINPFAYFFPALVLFIPVHLGFHPLVIFYLGRLTNFFVCAAICLYAIKLLAPQYRKILYLVLLLPMTLQQLSSYSKDAWHISFGLLFFSLFVHLQKKTYIRFWKPYLLLWLSGMIVVLTRLQHAPILFLALQPLVRWGVSQGRLKKINRSTKIAALIVFIVACVIFVLSIISYSINFLTFSFDSYVKNVYPAYQLQNILMDPVLFIQRLFDTIDWNFDFYLQSGVGMLGWLDTVLPQWVYFFYYGLFFYVVLTLPKQLLLRKKDLFLICTILIAVLFSTLLSFYLFWTQVGAGVVNGVQGRYFIVFIPFIALVVSEFLQRIEGKKLLWLGLLVGSVALYSLFNRYFNSSLYYYVELNGVATPRTVYVSQPYQYFLRLNPNKKLVGIVFHLGKFKDATVEPAMLEVRDAQCSTVLRKKVLDMSQVKSDQDYQVMFDGVKISGTDQVCITLVPMGKVGTAQDFPLVLNEENQPLTQLVYLY